MGQRPNEREKATNQFVCGLPWRLLVNAEELDIDRLEKGPEFYRQIFVKSG